MKGIYFSPTAFCFLPSALCLLLTADCRLPSAFWLLLTAGCLLRLRCRDGDRAALRRAGAGT
jgi:hypothetical protein